MKKLAIILVVLAMVGGCQTLQNWYCSNRAIIENAIQTAQNTITAVEATFPGVIPPEYQAVIDEARGIVSEGEAMLAARFCPADTDVQTIQVKQLAVGKSLNKAIAKNMKNMKK